ncbi:MAG TPA: oligosaccharide flippase family protein [Solirubrobacteraceae bacterium]|nr:oligosaccharide flippase family protein [Solirubrobacteraceae bacterium]
MNAAPPDLIDTSAAGPAAMRGGLLRMGAFAGSLLIGLASAPLLVRHLGEVEFGRYSTALAIVAIVAGLTEGGVATVALRELSVATQPDERRRLMSDLLGLRLVLSTGGVAVAVLFTAVAGYGADLTLGVLLASVGMALTTTQLLLVVELQSRLRFGWAALIELARGIVGIALIVVLVLAGEGTVPLLAVSIAAGLAALALTVPLVRGTLSLRPAFAAHRWLPLVREVMIVALAVAVYALYFRVTLLITSLVSSAEQTGYFSISFRLMEALVGIPALLIGAAFPIISRSARDDRERFEYAASRIYELAVFLGGLMALGLLLSAPFAIELLVGTSDHPSVEVLQIQSAALLAGFVVAATSFPLLGMRRYRELLIATGGSLVLTAGLALGLAPAHGADGAAVAAVTGDFVLAGALTLALMRGSGPPLPLSAVAVTLAAGALGYGAGRLAGVHPFLDALVGCTVFLAVLAALRRFPPELREVLDMRRSGR